MPPSRIVRRSCSSVEGYALTSCGMLAACSRIDCILGPHRSNSPRDPDDGVGGLVAVGEDARVEQVDSDRATLVGQVVLYLGYGDSCGPGG